MAKKVSTLDLGNSLIIDNATTLKEKFDKKLAEGSNLTVQSGVMGEIDLTGLQLLNYMLVQSQKKGSAIKFHLKIDKEQEELLLKCGFTQIKQNLFT